MVIFAGVTPIKYSAEDYKKAVQELFYWQYGRKPE